MRQGHVVVHGHRCHMDNNEVAWWDDESRCCDAERMHAQEWKLEVGLGQGSASACSVEYCGNIGCGTVAHSPALIYGHNG
jgi:hypothetical protein